MAQVETARGPIDDSELGFTLSHEHVFTANSGDNHWYPWLYDFDASRRVILERLAAARAVGVQTLIDLTTPDLGRDAALVREMSEQSGMHVDLRHGHVAHRPDVLHQPRPPTRSPTSSCARSRSASATPASRPA